VKATVLRVRVPRRIGAGVCIGVAGLALVACGDSDSGSASASSSSPGSKAITIQLSPLVDGAPVSWAIDKGLFKKQGLDVKTITWTSQKALPTLLNGQASIALDGAAATVGFLSQSIPLEIVAGTNVQDSDPESVTSSIIANPKSGIGRYKDLEGKKVAIGGLKGSSQAFAEARIREDGGDPKKVKLIRIPFTGMVSAYKAGKVDAAVIAQPYQSQAIAAGAKMVGPLFPTGYSSVYFVTKSFASQHRDQVVAFRKVLQESYDYANAHWDEVKAAYVTRNGLKPEEAESLPKTATFKLDVDTNSLQASIDAMRASHLLGDTDVDPTEVLFK
jgi:NitT/TauT family transport system substrate-binding protein